LLGLGEILPTYDKKHCRNPNHPAKGSAIRVEPIRDRQAIQQIKIHLQDKPRDLCLFTLGINTAYRANELLSLTIGQVAHAKVGSRLTLKQSKTKEYRTVYLNFVCIESIEKWLTQHPNPASEAPLFISRKRNRRTGQYQAIQVSSLTAMVKDWCNRAKLIGNYGSHSLRKTWGYHQRTPNNASVALLMRAYGHSSEVQTLNYLGIEDEEIRKLFNLHL